MKWNTALQQIGMALKDGKDVCIRYHRKWMKNDSHIDQVESLSEYTWNGWIKYAVNTFHDQLLDSTHIIDEVIIGKEANENDKN